MGSCAILLERQGNNDWEWIKRCITCQLLISDCYPLNCTPFFRMQVGGFYYRLQPVVEFPPCYPEELHKFTLCHGYLSVSFANDLHFAAPIKITTLIGRVCSYFWIVVCLHAVSSILQITISEGSQASLTLFYS